jgi:ribonucleoside-triphosphate reductase (formate)
MGTGADPKAAKKSGPAIRVIKTNGQSSDATDIALMVATSSQQEINIWDKSKIINSLVKEVGAAEVLAREIADSVEKRLVDAGLTQVTTSIIREFVDLELLQRGLGRMHEQHSHLGLPMYDVEQIIGTANKENSNTTHNPESINLTLAEAILKDFALRRVFSDDIAQAHLVGDIHLHDLGFIVRPYTYMGDSIVVTKKDGEGKALGSIKQFYEHLPFELNAEPGVWVKKPLAPIYVLDKDNNWTRVKQLTKKARNSKQMIFVRTGDGKQQVVTFDHPMITQRGIIQCAELKVGDRLSTEGSVAVRPAAAGGVGYINLVEQFTQAAVPNTRYNVWLEEKVSLASVQRQAFAGDARLHDFSTAFIGPAQKTRWCRPATMKLTPQLGWLLGLYIAKGQQREQGLVFSCEGEVKERLTQVCRALGADLQAPSGSNWAIVNDVVLRDLFINVWEVGESPSDKKLPRQIIGYRHDFVKAVVAGIVDGEGAVNGDSITLRAGSAALINQLSYVLEWLGFNSSAHEPGAPMGTVRSQNGQTTIKPYPVWGLNFIRQADIELPSIKYGEAACGQNQAIAAGDVEVTHVRPVEIGDEFIYDITTESHTFMCNGIYSHNCGGHSLEYLKKYGLNLPNITSTSKPAKHPEVLIGHMVKMASSLQSNYAGAIGWEAVNMFFAPFLVGLPYERIKQLAQMLIYEFNQLAGARGSQVVFTDFNLYYNIPRHFLETQAIGPGGEYTGLTYKYYEKEAQDFLRAMFEIYMDGDAMGKTFVFPKPLLHLNDDFFATDGWEQMLDLACKVASRQGITYFLFDRGDEVRVAQCCRLKLKLGEKDLADTRRPEKMRFTSLQNVTVNLPRVAYKAGGDDAKLFEELGKTMEKVADAHLQKKKFIGTLLDLGTKGPLSLFLAGADGEPYLRLNRLTYIAGLLGLNEMVQAHLGEQLHESQRALKFGLRVVSEMQLKCKELSKRHDINLVIEESPAESAAYRLAKLDMKYYPASAREVIKGSLANNEYYYTNSVHLAPDAPVDYIERVKKQGLFHPLMEAGAFVHIWLGESEPSPESIKNFVIKTYKHTEAEQIAFSPEFTVCDGCRQTSRGLSETCPKCGADDVYGITRVVGYFSKVQTWNKGKVGELKQRVRTELGEGAAWRDPVSATAV